VRLAPCEVLALVSILQSLVAAEIAIALHLRDFLSPAIFEFFNTIRHNPSFASISVADFSSHQRRLSATRNPALLVRHEALC
jgi:hypothetical protein